MSSGHLSSVGGLCRFSNGHGFTPRDWAREGLPIIRIQNLNGSRQFNYYQGTPEPEWLVESGQLLFAWAGVRGVSFGPTIWGGPRGVLNQHIYRIEPNADIDKTWLHAALRVVTNRIERKAHGFKSSLVHVKKADITSQMVFVPPTEEQRRIAELLTSADSAIDLTEQLIAAKKECRAWLMQQLFTGKRRLSKSAKPWRRVYLGDLLGESRTPVVTSDPGRRITVRLWCGGVEQRELKAEVGNATIYYKRRAGQFIYGKQNLHRGAVGIVPAELDGYSSTQDVPAFDIRTDEIDPYFLLCIFSMEQFYRNLEQYATGTGSKRVHPEQLLDLKLSLPSLADQREISSCLQLHDNEVELLKRVLRARQEQKQGLMQQLLTGKRRLA